MQLWSTKNAAAPQKCSSLHSGGPVKGIAKLANTHKFVLANNHNLKVFDYVMNEVVCERSFIKAHRREITGVSAHPTASRMFATCAADKNCVQWDMKQKQRKAASHIYRNFENQPTAIYWTTQEEKKELLMIGDEIGNLLTLDPRSPNRILSETKVSNRGIRKIIFNGSKQFAVIARSNKALILELDHRGDFKLVYEHVASGIVYDFCWDRKDSRKFYVVGEHHYAAADEIQA